MCTLSLISFYKYQFRRVPSSLAIYRSRYGLRALCHFLNQATNCNNLFFVGQERLKLVEDNFGAFFWQNKQIKVQMPIYVEDKKCKAWFMEAYFCTVTSRLYLNPTSRARTKEGLVGLKVIEIVNYLLFLR